MEMLSRYSARQKKNRIEQQKTKRLTHTFNVCESVCVFTHTFTETALLTGDTQTTSDLRTRFPWNFNSFEPNPFTRGRHLYSRMQIDFCVLECCSSLIHTHIYVNEMQC